MAQDIVVSMDDELKLSFEEVCKDIGISAASAIRIFAKRVARERKIPFELSAAPLDPFYSESNMAHLRRGIAAFQAGEFKEHDLIEVADDAWEDYLYWQTQDKKTLKRINRDNALHIFSCRGHYE